MEILFLLAEGDGHGEEVPEFADEVVEQHYHFDEGLTVPEYPFPPGLLLVGFIRGQFKSLTLIPVAVALQPNKIIIEKLLDLVHFDAFILHLLALLAESGVDVDDEVG